MKLTPMVYLTQKPGQHTILEEVRMPAVFVGAEYERSNPMRVDVQEARQHTAIAVLTILGPSKTLPPQIQISALKAALVTKISMARLVVHVCRVM